MSALAEQVAREHRSHNGFRCACNYYPTGDVGINADRTRHLIEVTEQAVRASVAAEIREQAVTFMRVTLATYDDLAVKAYLDAYRIAEGKQP